MRRYFGLVLLFACGGGGADAQTEAAPSWYDAQPLLANLRPAEARGAAQAVAPRQLTDLPFYDLELELAPSLDSFTMGEDIYFTNTTGQALQSVVLRLYVNAVGDSPQVRLTGSECVGTRCQVAWDRRSEFEVRPATPLAPGGQLRIRLQLEGTLQAIDESRNSLFAQAMEGLSRQGNGGEHGDYGLLAHSGGVASLGNFYAMVAPFEDGDWIRAADSSGTLGDLGADALCHFRMQLQAPAGARVATTGTIVEDQTVLARGDTPARRQLTTVASLSRNFALVVGADLQMGSRRVGDVEVRSWYRADHRAAGDAVLETAAEALRIFERRFGPYPFRDLEVAEAPLVGGAGGVEFSSMMTVASMFYGSSPGLGGLGGLGDLSALLGGGAGGRSAGAGGSMVDSMLEFVVAHEIAHQWWHGIVGSDARRHPYVDESLAQFSAMLYMEDRYGAERARTEGDRQVAANYHMMRLQGGADGPVDRAASDFPDETAYAGLVYGKGPYFYPAVRQALGDRAFFQRLQRYVRTHRFGVAGARSIVDALATGRRSDRVRALARRWLDQSHGDEDLGEADMQQMMQSWMGDAAGVGELLQGLQGGMGLDGNTDEALRDAIRQLESIR